MSLGVVRLDVGVVSDDSYKWGTVAIDGYWGWVPFAVAVDATWWCTGGWGGVERLSATLVACLRKDVRVGQGVSAPHSPVIDELDNMMMGRLGQSRPFHGYTPSKHSNNQPGQGLLQTFLIWKAITTSSLDLKFFYCPMHYPKVS